MVEEKQGLDPQRFLAMRNRFGTMSDADKARLKESMEKERQTIDNRDRIVNDVRTNNSRRVFNESLFDEPLGKRLLTLDDWRIPKQARLTDKQKMIYNHYYERALAFCDEVVQGCAPNLMLFGKPGAGKTYLAQAIMGTLIQCKQIVLFININALKRLAYRFNDPNAQERVDRLKDYAKLADLLIIDDLGAESGVSKERTVTASQTIQDLLYSFSNTHPILITSNVHFSDLQKTYHERIISRLIPNSVENAASGTKYSEHNLLVFDKLQDLRNLQEAYAQISRVELEEGADESSMGMGDWRDE